VDADVGLQSIDKSLDLTETAAEPPIGKIRIRVPEKSFAIISDDGVAPGRTLAGITECIAAKPVGAEGREREGENLKKWAVPPAKGEKRSRGLCRGTQASFGVPWLAENQRAILAICPGSQIFSESGVSQAPAASHRVSGS
jgi:hypothetical protein